jgi:hypothetical protein
LFVDIVVTVRGEEMHLYMPVDVAVTGVHPRQFQISEFEKVY